MDQEQVLADMGLHPKCLALLKDRYSSVPKVTSRS